MNPKFSVSDRNLVFEVTKLLCLIFSEGSFASSTFLNWSFLYIWEIIEHNTELQILFEIENCLVDRGLALTGFHILGRLIVKNLNVNSKNGGPLNSQILYKKRKTPKKL